MKNMQENLEYAYEKLKVQEVIDELKLECFTAKDLRVTFREMLQYVKQLDCPVVFCHHDFRGGNILVTEPDHKVKIIDLEYCGYGQRGYDMGTFFTEWGTAELFEEMPTLLPPQEAVEQFCRYYLEAFDRLVPGYSSKPENSLDRVVKEAKLFYAVQNMFFMTSMIRKEDSIIPSIPFDPKTKMVSLN